MPIQGLAGWQIWRRWRLPSGPKGMAVAWTGVALAIILLGLLSALSVWNAAPAGRGLTADGQCAVPLTSWVQTPGGDWMPQSMPLRWAGAETGEPRHFRLRFDFQMPEPPTEMWSLRVDRISPDHAIWLNGALLSGHTGPSGPLGRFSVLPRRFAIPPVFLKSGANALEISLELGYRLGGLSLPCVGPAVLQDPGFARNWWWSVSLPWGLNVAAAGLALFFLLLWGLRRSELLLGLFGGLWLMVSLRNLAYFSGTDRVQLVPSAVAEWLFFVTQLASAWMLLGVACAVAARPWPLSRRWTWRVLLGLLLPSISAAWADRMPLARLVLYPVLIGLVMVSMGILWNGMSKMPKTSRRWLGLAMVSLLTAVLHDYFFTIGLAPASDSFWIPYVTPIIMVGAARALLWRFVEVLNLAEHHAQVLEQRVAERTRELEWANAAKTRFVAAASHDLRQPVTSIGLLSGLLREQLGAGPHRMVLDRLGESVSALDALLKGLLDLSRFEAGTVAVRPTPIRLQTLFDAILAHEADSAKAKGLKLHVRGGDRVVWADRVLLEQVLRNLVNNAVRYTRRGAVLISARPRRNQVLIQVWDTGVGIPAHLQTTVFEEFVQLDNKLQPAGSGQPRGLGLGLALVKRASELLRAPIGLRSELGQGSCFSLHLPQARAASEPRAAVWFDAGWPASVRWVITVDDDTSLRQSLRLGLEAWGVSVQDFDGVVSLRAALNRGDGVARPDLLLTDQSMPDGQATDVVAALRAVFPGTPVLVVTGDTGAAVQQHLARAGLPVLHKPFSAAELCAEVRRVMAATATR